MDDILIVEDDRALSQGIRLGLEGEGRRFIQTSTLDQGERALEERPFSLVVLDLNLPDGSGLELLRRLRARSALPVLILTANDLELGADDYVTKPFSLAVLRARVNNLLRRAHSRRTVLELPPFTFDFQEMTYTRNGVPLELSRTEQRLLRLLAEHRGQTLPRARLLEQVWDGGEFVDENALSVAVNRLRAKLTDAPIRTVYGVGYVWAVEP
jgi:DNA-binding response OmpR family regulator